MAVSRLPYPSWPAPAPLARSADVSAARGPGASGDLSALHASCPAGDLSALRASGPAGDLSAIRAFGARTPAPLAPPRLLAESSPPMHRPARPNGGTP